MLKRDNTLLEVRAEQFKSEKESLARKLAVAEAALREKDEKIGELD